MGTPKALLLFDGTPLIVHIVATLRRLFAEVVVVAAPGQDLPSMPVTLVRDEVAYQGPGRRALLRARRRPRGGQLRHLLRFGVSERRPDLTSRLPDTGARRGRASLAGPRPAAACGLSTQRAAAARGAQLARGELRPVYLFDRVRTRRIDEEEIRRFDPDGSSFFNMNTPEDYAEALRRWSHVAPTSRSRMPRFSAPSSCSGSRALPGTHAGGASQAPRGRDVLAGLCGARREAAGAGRHASSTPIGARLIDGYACNVNGLDFVRTPTATVNPGDNIVILSADAGG